MLRAQGASAAATAAALSKMVAAMAREDLKTALQYVREWNTNARNSHMAQALLRAVLLMRTPEEILAVPGEGGGYSRRGGKGGGRKGDG